MCPNVFVTQFIYLCAGEATKTLPKQCEDLPRDLFGFFKSSAKRRAVLSKFEDYVDAESHNLLLASQTRWLSLHPVINRILEQWSALVLFFTDMVHEERLASADRILQSLSDPSVKLHFFLWTGYYQSLMQ